MLYKWAENESLVQQAKNFENRWSRQWRRKIFSWLRAADMRKLYLLWHIFEEATTSFPLCWNVDFTYSTTRAALTRCDIVAMLLTLLLLPLVRKWSFNDHCMTSGCFEFSLWLHTHTYTHTYVHTVSVSTSLQEKLDYLQVSVNWF